MKIDVITLFPKMFDSPFAESMMKRAIEKNVLELNLHDMRQWSWNSYGSVDDKPYGGGVGMLIRVDVVDKAIKTLCPPEADISLEKGNLQRKIILTSAKGKRFTQETAERWAKCDNLVFICGHYEGFDERVSELVDEEVSIGDFVLTNGEMPTMMMIDATVRLLPQVLGKDESSLVESFSLPDRILEYPQYTRPAEYLGNKVPEVLLGGDPKKIKEWQKEQQSQVTKK